MEKDSSYRYYIGNISEYDRTADIAIHSASRKGVYRPSYEVDTFRGNVFAPKTKTYIPTEEPDFQPRERSVGVQPPTLIAQEETEEIIFQQEDNALHQQMETEIYVTHTTELPLESPFRPHTPKIKTEIQIRIAEIEKELAEINQARKTKLISKGEFSERKQALHDELARTKGERNGARTNIRI